MKCSFCGYTVKPGMGKMFVTKSGEIKIFCSSKCERNWLLRRDPKKLKWTKFYVKKK